MEKNSTRGQICEGCGQETNTAQDKAECYFYELLKRGSALTVSISFGHGLHLAT